MASVSISMDDFRAMTRFLDVKKVEFHTYTLKEDIESAEVKHTPRFRPGLSLR
jgi:hypothetical protein